MKKLILLNTTGASDSKQAETIIASLPEVDSVSIISNSSQLPATVAASQEDEFIIADMSLLSYPEQIAQAISARRSGDMNLFHVGKSADGLSESVTADNIVSIITAEEQFNLVAASTTGEVLKNLSALSADLSTNEVLASLMVIGVANSYSTFINSGQLTFAVDAEISSILNNSQKAKMLSFALNSINIEDLFPNYAWAEFEKESAAACFHTLAAHFIRLGDTSSAEECLAMSEGLEDSPRALALRAMIFKQQGQTLGAVANLVSSLQQYETRKKNTKEEHYLSFSPTNIEVVNSSLQKGLSALNKHENDQAFNHFVEAVFNFDDFYQTTGITQIKN